MRTTRAAIERVRVAVMDEARAFWSDRGGRRQMAARHSRRAAAVGAARPGPARATPTRRWPTASPTPSPRCGATEYRLYPDAHATVDALRQAGVKLALVTNGAAETQRDKIERFDLAHRFDHIQIEGEFGQGKPELAVYRHALERLGCEACDAWMVGDNYEWEVVAPQQLGMCGIWYDPFEAGVPAHATAQPTRMIKRLAELRGSKRSAA